MDYQNLPQGRVGTRRTAVGDLTAIVPNIDLTVFAEAFRNIQIDPYCLGPYRWRAASRFSCASELVQLPNVPLYQASEFNNIPGYGGIKRNYPDIPASLVAARDFERVLRLWIEGIGHPIETLSVHQIRTTAPGLPVPEGKHRDGNDWVGIFVVDRHALTEDCGVTTVWDSDGNVLLQRIVQPGELVSFDDRVTFHDTSAIEPLPNARGYRDVFVFSTPDHEHYLNDAEKDNGRQDKAR